MAVRLNLIKNYGIEYSKKGASFIVSLFSTLKDGGEAEFDFRASGLYEIAAVRSLIEGRIIDSLDNRMDEDI